MEDDMGLVGRPLASTSRSSPRAVRDVAPHGRAGVSRARENDMSKKTFDNVRVNEIFSSEPKEEENEKKMMTMTVDLGDAEKSFVVVAFLLNSVQHGFLFLSLHIVDVDHFSGLQCRGSCRPWTSHSVLAELAGSSGLFSCLPAVSSVDDRPLPFFGYCQGIGVGHLGVKCGS